MACSFYVIIKRQLSHAIHTLEFVYKCTVFKSTWNSANHTDGQLVIAGFGGKGLKQRIARSREEEAMATKMSCKVLATLFLFFVASLTSTPVQAATPWPIPEGVKTIEVNGYPMAYRDTGSGIPLVLVHGGFSDYRIWSSKQIPIFSKFYRTIAVSLRQQYPEKWDGVGNDCSIEQHA